MKIHSLLGICLALPAIVRSTLSCQRGERHYVRKDIMEFTPRELHCWHNALEKMIKDQTYHKLAALHRTFGLTGHQDYKFCPAHSELIRRFECDLVQAAAETGCHLPGAPFFDMGKRSQAWAQGKTELFTDKYVGKCKPFACLQGKFAGIKAKQPIAELQLPSDPNCVWRTCDFGPVLPEAGELAVLHDSTSLTSMGEGVFTSNHLQAHKQLGGYMGICRESAYDPFFW